MAAQQPPAQAPPAQQQQQQQPPPPMHPPNAQVLLDQLQGMLNGVLIEVGYSVKNPARAQLSFPTPQNSTGPPKYTNASISASLERFHLHLDDLDKELARAKAVLRRDLAVQQQAREKREQAERAQRAEAEKAAPVQQTPVHQQQHRQQQPDEDVDMTEAPDEAEKAEKETVETSASAQPPNPSPIQINPMTTTTGEPSAQQQPVPATATTDDLLGRTPPTAGVKETDFDSMFEDYTNNGNNNNNESNEPDAVNPDNQGGDDMDFTLLPGLESYANAAEGDTAPQQTGTEIAPEIDSSALDKSANNDAEQQKATEEAEKKKAEEEEEQQKKKKEEEEKKAQEQQQTEGNRNGQQQDGQDGNANQDMFQPDSTFDDLFEFGNFDDQAGESFQGQTNFDEDFFNFD